MFDRPFFDLLLLPPLNRVVPARYDEELSCAMCGPVTVIKKEKKKKGKRPDRERCRLCQWKKVIIVFIGYKKATFCTVRLATEGHQSSFDLVTL